MKVNPRWRALHVHYHADSTALLLDGLAPAVGRLAREGWIDRFFFVRYALGGPHLRLRLRVAGGEATAEMVLSAVEQAALDYFAHAPSAASWPAERIRSRNQAILAGDPNESDDAVYPDNSVRRAPFVPEVGRYGGPDLLPLSLDLFTLSSLAALATLGKCRAEPRSRQLATFLRLWARQFLGFTEDCSRLANLARALALPSEAGERLAPILAKADQVFSADRESFIRLIEQAAADRWGAGEEAITALHRGARGLSRALAGTDLQAAWRIRGSHMHMTANRLGLSHVEEAYLGRLLARAIEAADLVEAPARDQQAPVEFGPSRSELSTRAAGELAELASRALAELAAPASPCDGPRTGPRCTESRPPRRRVS